VGSLAESLALIVVYLACAWLGLAQASLWGHAGPVELCAGVALAGLFLQGTSRWPALFLASLLVHLLAGSLPTGAVLLLATGNTLEALLGVWLLERLDFQPGLQRVRDVLVLALVAVVAPGVDILARALIAAPGGALVPEHVTGAVGSSGLSHGLGMLVVGAGWMRLARFRKDLGRGRSRAGVFGLVLLVAVWLLGGAWSALFGAPPKVGVEHWLEPRLFLGLVAFIGLLLLAARAERAASSARLEVLATAVRDVREGVVVCELSPEASARLVFANAAFLEMGGWRQEEVLGHPLLALCGEGLEPVLRERRPFQGEIVMKHRDGSPVYSEVRVSFVAGARGAPELVVTTHRDLTAQKRLQEQLVSAGRIAAVGTLAAGVGHEINNPLAYLLLNLEGATRSLKKGPEHLAEARARLECVREGAERIRLIARDLKVFSRQEGEEREMLDVNEVVVPALRMAAHAVRARARLVEEFGSPPPVLGCEVRLGQVLLNLLVNALQAIPEGRPEHYEVRVRTGRDESGRALVEVSDTGCGMSAPVLERIFEPFYTTKPSGEGTGLGLAICQQIVRAHGGELRVNSEQGKGSVFTLVLPAASSDANAPAPVPEPAVLAPVAPPRRRILVIDDEPRLAQSMRMLIEPSHDVVVTTRGAEALAWVSEGQRYDLVLCDLQMPGTTGMDVYSHLRAHAPELLDRLVFISGGAYTQVMRDFVRSVRNRILEKPVRPDDLLATIDEALATSSAA
jgi:PAS domain S-box-containing protein